MGMEWQLVGQVAPDGMQELTHQELQQTLEQRTQDGRLVEPLALEGEPEVTPQQSQQMREQRTSLSREDWARMHLERTSPQQVVRAGKSFFQPVVYGRADWTGAPQHDHAKISVSVACDVLKFERGLTADHRGARRSRPRLNDWKRITPELNATLHEGVQGAAQRGAKDSSR